MHPLHVQHGSEQTDVVVNSTERLHAFKQLWRKQTCCKVFYGSHLQPISCGFLLDSESLCIQWKTSEITKIRSCVLADALCSPLWSSAGQSRQGAATGSGKVWSEEPPSLPSPTSWWSTCGPRSVCRTPGWKGRASACMPRCGRWRDLLPEAEADKRAGEREEEKT